MHVVVIFGGLLVVLLLSLVTSPLEKTEVDIEVPDKVEGPKPELKESKLEVTAPEPDLELIAFRADLDAFGSGRIKDRIPDDAIFKHPLAEVSIDDRGFGILNSFAYSSLLINDAYLHPLVGNTQRESARAFLQSILGKETFASMHPQLINRQTISVLQACTLISTAIESQLEK